jgi:hypothetical protein
MGLLAVPTRGLNSGKPILIQYEPRRRAGTSLAQVLSDYFPIFELASSETKKTPRLAWSPQNVWIGD